MSKNQKDIKPNTTATDNVPESKQEMAQRFFAEMQQGIKDMQIPVISHGQR